MHNKEQLLPVSTPAKCSNSSGSSYQLQQLSAAGGLCLVPAARALGILRAEAPGNHALQSPDRAHQHGNSKPRLCMRGGPLQSSISSFSLWPSPCPAQGALVSALHKAGHSLSTQLDLLLPRYAKSSSLQKTPTQHLAWRGSPLSSPGSICRR